MQLSCSKDMSVRVSPCANYDFNALTPVVCGTDNTFLHLITEMSDGF